ncbi:MAG: class I SAM-dependent methyltransferase [Sphaerotilus natans subsp. sulfidivorans]|uniref:class I SAM-dependent methyltransferase n=1 Tax=Sphaerotilus sulfidivorans TaxID=639200 RepID=UPI002352CFAB|nr:class I SAM-dependent methyltransferase [Sphaerotilus sulfidivorans]MCK6403133.1 class I SAM-dependent methyltransferase [Sphaerotilus sulfidivorans]
MRPSIRSPRIALPRTDERRRTGSRKSVLPTDVARHVPPRRTLPWPLPALLAWALAWSLWITAASSGLPAAAGFVLATLSAGLFAIGARTRWRRLMTLGGFPLSLALSGLAQGMAAALWLLPLALLAAAYPLRAWRDAPLFPTEADALEGLETLVPLPPMARVLDAGCGLGHGLQALQKVWPDARMEGIEWSWPIRLAAGLRCPWARIRQGDMWAASWAEHDLVYLFQRPESMNRAAEKALAEMRPGSWLVSLEFDVPGMRPHARLQNEGHRPVWIYAIR